MNQLLPSVTEFLAAQPLQMYIGRAWVPADNGTTFDTRDPGTGEVLARIAAGDKIDVDRAFAAAQDALQRSGWAHNSKRQFSNSVISILGGAG